MTSPVVSVLLTAYNRERYIGPAIESVLAQRFTDFELVIVDDGSVDGTARIAREYAAGDRRIRLYVNPLNLGQFANRNHAATLARGRFLKYHDSDDLMYPQCLETMVSALQNEPRAAFAMSASGAWAGGPVPMLVTPRQCYQREFLGFGLFMCGPSCAMFRTDAFHRLGGFPDVGVHGDYLFWLRACARCSVLLVNADLFWYRRHAGQELQSAGAARDYAQLPGDVWRMLHSDDCPLYGEDLERARRNQAWTVAKHLWRDVGAGRLSLAGVRLRHCGLSVADWIKYLRRPLRSALAGTPLDERGEHPAAEWLRASAERSAR